MNLDNVAPQYGIGLTSYGLSRPGAMCAETLVRICSVVEAPVMQVFGVGREELFQTRRGAAPVALARQVAMYLAHICCGLSFTEIGHLFGRDRTTVAHACAVIEDRRDDPVFDRTLELLEWVVPSLLLPHRPHVPLMHDSA